MNINKGDVVVDATLGVGGHALEIAKRVGKQGKVIAFDMDLDAINEFENKIRHEHPELRDRFSLVNENFADLDNQLGKLRVGKVGGILADLGWRIEQVQDDKYGMSFLRDSRLDMRMDQSAEESAFEIVNDWSEDKLAELLRDFGEEKNSKRIAKAILKERGKNAIETTKQLADLVENVNSSKRTRIHPATRTFQALRIKVNSEFENIEKLLSCAIQDLKVGGRVAVITFHSLEDRIVKKFFQANARGCVCPKEFPICVCGGKEKLEIITKKPILPSKLEVGSNPRARSAKLRVAEKI